MARKVKPETPDTLAAPPAPGAVIPEAAVGGDTLPSAGAVGSAAPEPLSPTMSELADHAAAVLSGVLANGDIDLSECWTVSGPKRGRRRAGMYFGLQAVLVDLRSLTDAQRDAIKDDPMLLVRPALRASTD